MLYAALALLDTPVAVLLTAALAAPKSHHAPLLGAAPFALTERVASGVRAAPKLLLPLRWQVDAPLARGAAFSVPRVARPDTAAAAAAAAARRSASTPSTARSSVLHAYV